MIKFQTSKLTLKNFLLHYMLSIILTTIYFFDILNEKTIKEIFILIGTASIIPGLIISTLLIASAKEFLCAVKQKNYIAIVVMIVFAVLFTKYFYKL